jgi:hypothetical protein
MPLNAQTATFPPIYQPEQSWSQNLRASMDLLAPGSGIRQGLQLGLPLSGGLVTTGFTPTLTEGYLVRGDEILGPNGPRLTKAATANLTNRNVYFGLNGLNYAASNNLPPIASDALIGRISTDGAGILHMGQPYNYGACRFGIRGVVNLARCAKGADVDFFTLTPPDLSGLGNLRVTYAQARVLEAVSAGNATGDDFLLKIKNGSDAAVTLATIAAASLTAGTIVRKNVLTADVLSFVAPTAINFQYNQTDASANFVGGAVEVYVLFELF